MPKAETFGENHGYSKKVQASEKQAKAPGPPVNDWLPKHQALLHVTGQAYSKRIIIEREARLERRRNRPPSKLRRRIGRPDGPPVFLWLKPHANNIDKALRWNRFAEKRRVHSQEGRKDIITHPNMEGRAEFTVKPKHMHPRFVRRNSGEPVVLLSRSGYAANENGIAKVARSNNVTIFRYDNTSNHDHDFPVARRTAPTLTAGITPHIVSSDLPSAGLRRQVENARAQTMEKRMR